MQYMLLIYDDPDVWDKFSPEEYQSFYPEYAAVAQDPATRDGGRLQPSNTATTVRVDEGATLTTDGPFTETKEQLGGYFIVEADSPEEAVTIAARIPSARLGGAVEVRPLAER